MTRVQNEIISRLRNFLKARAENISSSAQLMLTTADVQHGRVAEDFQKISDCALKIYDRVSKDLTPTHFNAANRPFDDEMQHLRHDLRGLLNTIMGPPQLAELTEGLPQTVRDEFSRIYTVALACEEELDRNRDSPNLRDENDVELHDRDASTLSELLPADDELKSQTQPATILVVDDDDDSREALKRFLQHLHHTVHTVKGGVPALEFLASQDVDLILLDLQMPGMNGFQLLDLLREKKVLQCTPVIIVSGMDFKTHAVRGIEKGADDYLSRPINLALLRARVNAALERQRLRERELAQFFTPELARDLMRHPDHLRAGRSVKVSVLFLDVVGFSRVSERLGPAGTIAWLSRAMETFCTCIQQHHGVLVDFTGDQIMALWGAPQAQPDHATLACEAALALWNCLPEINLQTGNIAGEPTEVAIGVNTGEAFVGNVGTPQRFKYGALGNTVNLASRLQSATKHVHARILISGETRANLTAPLLCRRLARLRVNNIEQPVDVSELATSTDDLHVGLFKEYEEALNQFEKGALQTASALLGDILKRHPDDGPSLLLLSRTVESMLLKSDKHDPVWVLPGK